MNTVPTLSVLMPVYNGATYLAQAIQSIQAQTVGNFELVVVNDGSTDATLDILWRFAKTDGRIKILTRSNTGIVGALNDGLAVCRAKFVARMDADDVAMDTRFAQQLAAIGQEPHCVALGSAALFTDPEGRPLKIYRPPLAHASIEDELARGNGGALIHPTVLFRRDALTACGGYRERYNYIEDLDLYVRLLERGRLANLPEVLLHYRQHPGSINHVQGNRTRQTAEIIAPLRKKKGLDPWTPPPEPRSKPEGIADFRRQWALDAAQNENYDSAWANALQAVRLAPFKKINWSCLRYIHGLRRNLKKPA
jgi:glycosyltransferase involved in cell wall biosynthesis